MLQFLDTSRHVIALKIGGRIEGAELDAIMDRLEPMLSTGDDVHVFVETRAITGIALGGLARYTARAAPLLRRLRKFGRVAVVADQGWIRFATRIESLLLPNISYRTFTPDRSDEALAWVEGRAEPSR